MDGFPEDISMEDVQGMLGDAIKSPKRDKEGNSNNKSSSDEKRKSGVSTVPSGSGLTFLIDQHTTDDEPHTEEDEGQVDYAKIESDPDLTRDIIEAALSTKRGGGGRPSAKGKGIQCRQSLKDKLHSTYVAVIFP